MTDIKTPRRRSLLKGAAIVGGAMAAPVVATAQTTTSFRFQSTWPAKDLFHEYANDFARKVNDMAGGHGVVAYHYGKQSALALWGSGPAYGTNANMVLA